ncbi:leukocyte surface antigen CD53-like [Topomyia yanbarensis]|uniref:leukocyte surface antigen CD53-like n=1 Tax=Topomyia yanbarensis TaxID=2498891 RepID=UPI00273AA935|nr:leukocyte surface antigen CD53-like [Topomyia yanbarensis]
MTGFVDDSERQPQPPTQRTTSRKLVSLIKYLILFLTAVCLVLEVITIILGASVGNVFAEFAFFLDSNFHSLTRFMVVLGILMLLVVLYGCVGLILENMTIINIYVIVYSVLIVMEIIIAVTAYNMARSADAMLEARVKNAFLQFYQDRNAQRSVNHMQQRLQCCGFESYSDWYSWPHQDDFESLVPVSCFPSPHYETPFQIGCFGRMSELIRHVLHIIASGTTISIIFQVICVISAIFFLLQLRTYKKECALRNANSASVPPIYSLETIQEEKTPI